MIFKTCWVGTIGKGSNRSCLASIPGVDLLFYIPVTLCTLCIIFYVI